MTAVADFLFNTCIQNRKITPLTPSLFPIPAESKTAESPKVFSLIGGRKFLQKYPSWFLLKFPTLLQKVDLVLKPEFSMLTLS